LLLVDKACLRTTAGRSFRLGIPPRLSALSAKPCLVDKFALRRRHFASRLPAAEDAIDARFCGGVSGGGAATKQLRISRCAVGQVDAAVDQSSHFRGVDLRRMGQRGFFVIAYALFNRTLSSPSPGAKSRR